MSVHVVGNVTVDELFRVEGPPQKGASVLGVKVARDLGGKGANQALVMARAGLDIHLVAAVGNDDGGRWLRRELDAEGLSLRAIHEMDGPSDVSIIWRTPMETMQSSPPRRRPSA